MDKKLRMLNTLMGPHSS